MIFAKAHIFPIVSTVALQCEDGGPTYIWFSRRAEWHWSLWVIPHHQNDKNWQANKHNMRHICSTQISTKQYLWEQTKKGMEHLKDIFTDARSIEYDQIFHPYEAGTQVKILHNASGRKVFIIQQSQKLIPGLICMIVNWTVWLKLINPETWSQEMVKLYKR